MGLQRVGHDCATFTGELWKRRTNYVGQQLFIYKWGFPGGTSGKEQSANVRDLKDAGSISGLGRSPGGGPGNLLQYSFLENSMHRGAWGATTHWVAKS